VCGARGGWAESRTCACCLRVHAATQCLEQKTRLWRREALSALQCDKILGLRLTRMHPCAARSWSSAARCSASAPRRGTPRTRAARLRRQLTAAATPTLGRRRARRAPRRGRAHRRPLRPRPPAMQAPPSGGGGGKSARRRRRRGPRDRAQTLATSLAAAAKTPAAASRAGSRAVQAVRARPQPLWSLPKSRLLVRSGASIAKGMCMYTAHCVERHCQ